MRTAAERIFHAVLFEGGALVIVSPVVAWATGASILAAGGVSVVGSAVASFTTLGWTWLCDRWTPGRRRSASVRIAQALGLELMLSLYTIPAFLWLGAGLRNAVILECVVIAFFGAYTFMFNTLFDVIFVFLLSKGLLTNV